MWLGMWKWVIRQKTEYCIFLHIYNQNMWLFLYSKFHITFNSPQLLYETCGPNRLLWYIYTLIYILWSTLTGEFRWNRVSSIREIERKRIYTAYLIKGSNSALNGPTATWRRYAHLLWVLTLTGEFRLNQVSSIREMERKRIYTAYLIKGSNSALNSPTATWQRYAHLLLVLTLTGRFRWNRVSSIREIERKRMDPDGRTDRRKDRRTDGQRQNNIPLRFFESAGDN